MGKETLSMNEHWMVQLPQTKSVAEHTDQTESDALTYKFCGLRLTLLPPRVTAMKQRAELLPRQVVRIR